MEEQPQQPGLDELEFYSRCSKPLIFNLPDAKDRVQAAAWVKKIRDEAAGTEALRTQYIKLLLFALQRGHLVGIFSDDPTTYQELEPFPPEFDLNGIAKSLIEKEQALRVDRIKKQLRGQIGDFPPYTTDCSSDFREYVAAQDIPGFGVHCYYAISSEPVSVWYRADKGIFPKLAKSAINTTSPAPPVPVTATVSDPSCACAKKEAEAAECECKKGAKESPPAKKKKSPKKLGRTPPTSPLGIIPMHEDRPPPTWGSNLINVVEPPKQSDLVEEEPEPFDDEAFGLPEAIGGIDQFVEEFRKGKMDKSPRKSESPKKGIAHSTKIAEPHAAGEGQMGEEEEGDEEDKEEMDLNASQRMEKIKEDEQLVDYFKSQLSHSAVKQTITKTTQADKSSSPARVGIPLSTPKPSPSPRRPPSPEQLYEEESEEPPPKQKSPDVSIGDLDDDELAELGMTREEAKKLFDTDLFKMPGDEDFDISGEDMGLDDVDEEAPPLDDSFDEWDKKLRELEKEAEAELREHAVKMGLDADALDDVEGIDLEALEREAEGEEEAGAQSSGTCVPVCTQVCAAPEQVSQRPPTPQKEPEPKKKPGAKGLKKPGAKGKASKTKISKEAQTKQPPETAKGKAKETMSKSTQKDSKLQKPSASKLQKPSASKLQKPSASKLSKPGSKLQPPKAGKPQQGPPVKKGSPEAAPVLTEYERLMNIRTNIADILQEVEPDYPPDVERTPPMFSKHARVRQAAEGLVYAPDEFGLEEQIDWQPAADYLANQPEFEPYDPRQQRRVEEVFPGAADRKYGDEIFFDAQGEPDLFDEGEYVDQIEIPKSPASQRFEQLQAESRIEQSLYDTAVGDICQPCGSPDKSPPRSPLRSPQGMKTPEFVTQTHGLPESIAISQQHQPVKTPPTPPVRRRLFPQAGPPDRAPTSVFTPPSGTRTHFTPPMPPPSSEAPCPCSPTTAVQRPPTPQKMQTPPGQFLTPAADQFYTPAPPGQFQTPAAEQFYTPAQGPGPENYYTVQELSPEFKSILDDVTPKNILNVEEAPQFASPPCSPCSPGIEDRFASMGVAGNVGEIGEIPEIFVELVDDGPEEAAAPCGGGGPAGPSFAPMDRELMDVGYSVVDREPMQISDLEPEYLDYKSPTKRVKPDRRKLKEQEEKYIDFLFGKDKETLEMLKRAVALVADVEQEQEDPYHVIPQSPPFVGDRIEQEGDLYTEQIPVFEQMSPPPSPIPHQSTCSGASGSSMATSTPALRPSGLRPPGSGIRPPGSGIRPPGSGIRPPGSGIRPPGSGIRPPGSGIRPPGSGIRPPGSGIRPPGSGIRPPGSGGPCSSGAKSGIIPPGARTSGIVPPGSRLQPPKSGIPAPGGRRIPTPSTGKYQLQIPQLQRPSPATSPPCAPCASGDKGPGPAYFPSSQLDTGQQWPAIQPGFREELQRHQIDEVFYDERRPLLNARSVVAGRTSSKRKTIQRVSDPKMPPCRPRVQLTSDFPREQYQIEEDPNESPLPQTQYGVPGIQVPPRPVMQAPAWGSQDVCQPCQPATQRPPPASRLQPPSTGGPTPGSRLQQPSRIATPHPSGLRPPSTGPCQGSQLRPPSTGPAAGSQLRAPSRIATPQPSGLRPPSTGPAAGSQLRPPSRIATPQPSGLRPPSTGPAAGSQLRPPSGIATPHPSGLKPPSPASKPPAPQPPAAPCGVCESPEYDLEELAKYGLTAEDMKDIDVNLDVSDVSGISEIDEGIDEGPAYDPIDEALKKWEAHLDELEAEAAEDIAKYAGDDLAHIQLDGFGSEGGEQGEPLPCSCEGDEGEQQTEDRVFGRHTEKGFKPAYGRKVQYPIQEPQDEPQPSPVPWWEADTPPQPPFSPPCRPPQTDQGYAGFLGSPRPGTSRARTPSPQQYSPPQYDSPGQGLLEEGPPAGEGADWEELQIGPPSAGRPPSPTSAAARPPSPPPSPPPRPGVCQPEGPCQSFLGGEQLPSQKSGRSFTARRNLAFEFESIKPDVSNIADEYIEGVMERYHENLPPLPPEQGSPCQRTPPRSPAQLTAWQVPEEVENIVQKPQPKTPEQRFVMPETKPHEWFNALPQQVDQAVCIECSPVGLESPRSPTGRTPPRSPTISPQLAQNVSGEGIEDVSFECPPCSPSPKRTSPQRQQRPPSPTPSPPSPFSTQEAMDEMVANAKRYRGKEGITRRPWMFQPPQFHRVMEPIKETSTQPGVGKYGLPNVVQIDLQEIGDAIEEPCPCASYPPPPSRPPQIQQQPCGQQKGVRRNLAYEFESIAPETTNIADDYIDGVMERYDDNLPPLPPDPRSPQRTPPRSPWRVPEEVENIVQKQPKPKTPEQRFVMPETKPHEWFSALPQQVDQGVCIECSPVGLESPRSPTGRTPPRSPTISPQLAQNVSGEGIEDVSFECPPCSPSPKRTPPQRQQRPPSPTPSPPSPFSTQEAMEEMVTTAQKYQGREGIRRRPWMFQQPQFHRVMEPIKETSTQPGIGKYGLPNVVQIDLQEIGAAAEEPCPCTSGRPPPIQSSPEHDVVEEGDEELLPMTAEELQSVGHTSPLKPFQPKRASPPPRSPRFVSPIGGPTLADTAFDFETALEDLECECVGDEQWPDTSQFRTPERPAGQLHVTPKPSPMLTPGRSPSRTPPRTPPFPPARPGDALLSAEGMNFPGSPEYVSPQRTPQRAPSPQGSPQYMSPEWVKSPCGPCEPPGGTDEMGLPNLVQLYAQHMGPIYASPTEERQRPIISWQGPEGYDGQVVSPMQQTAPQRSQRSPPCGPRQGPASPARTPPGPRSPPITMPQLSPFRLPGERQPEQRPSSSPEQVITQTVTSRRFVTVLPTPPEFQQGTDSNLSGVSDSSGLGDEADFKWMD